MGRVIEHLPGVEPSTSTLPQPGAPVTTREGALKLMDQKKAIEAEMNGLWDYLNQEGVDMQTPLIDEEGFPRADIDVAAVRHARSRLYRLRTDLRILTEEIVKALEHVMARPPSPEVTESDAMEVESSQPVAFALVNGVAPTSPASEAGLKRSDRIFRFDILHAGNHDQLREMAGVLTRNEGKSITIRVLRPSDDAQDAEVEELSLTLIPKKWSGRGLLGCHVVPIP